MVLEENRKRGEYKKPVYLLYDQVYWQLTYGNTVHHDPVTLRPEMKNYTIFIDGISKAFSATGVRVGWAFGPQKVMDKMKSKMRVLRQLTQFFHVIKNPTLNWNSA